MTYDGIESELWPAVSEAAGKHGGVEVRTLSGKVVATLAIDSPQETAGALRHRLLKAIPDEDLRRRYGQSWLVHGCSVLPECRRLSECLSAQSADNSCSSPEMLAFTLVCATPSSLAEHLCQAGLEADGLVDVADSVFQAEHAISVRHQPRAEDVAHNIALGTRAKVVDWLAIACNAVACDDQIFHGAVLTLDRYCASQTTPVEESRLLRLSLAVLCTEMKLATNDEHPSGEWQRLILHLGQGRESLADIFATEAEVLRQVGFNVWVPTALTFLRGLGLRLCQGPNNQMLGDPAGPVSPSASLQLSFSFFFVEMVLYDVLLQYRFPLAVLAASALGAAQFATGLWSSATHETLMEDLASYCPALPEARGLAEECELLILEMWRDCSQGNSRWTECYANLCERHARPRHRPWVVREEIFLPQFGEHLHGASPEAALERFHAARQL